MRYVARENRKPDKINTYLGIGFRTIPTSLLGDKKHKTNFKLV